MSSEKRTSSVVWQIHQISQLMIALNNNKISHDYYKIRFIEIVEQSMKMHKDEICIAYDSGSNARLDYESQDFGTNDPFEFAERAQGTYRGCQQYYEQEYGKTD